MKKTLSLLFILLPFSLLINAQGNLEYNKIKLVTVSGIYTGSPIDTFFTVPVGKVWKIESAIAGTNSGIGNWYDFDFGLYLDDKKIYRPGNNIAFPIWLPTGSYKLSVRCLGTTNYIETKGAISAIEYNEVP